MLHRSLPARAGFIAALRNLISWNRSNAAAQLSTSAAEESPRSSSNSSSSSSFFSRGGVAPVAGAAVMDVDDARYPADVLLPHTEMVVRSRRSTKVFDETRPVDPQLIQRLLAATTRSPTANNLQCWHAIVVRGDDRAALCRAALGQRQILTAPYTVVFAGDSEPERNAPQVLEQGLENGSIGPLYGPNYLRSVYYHLHGGPLQSMAVAKSVLSRWYSSQTGTPLLSTPISRCGYAWKQSMIPATTFTYLATAAGLDTCIMEGIDEDAVKAVVGLPDRFTVPVVIAVGHAAPGDGYGGPRRPRSARFSVPHYIRWDKF